MKLPFAVHNIQRKLFNVITLEQTETDNINQMITITDFIVICIPLLNGTFKIRSH
jgi:hypothetical protein